MHLILSLGINIFALLVVQYVVPGFEFTSLSAVIVAAVIIGAVNTFIRPILQFIALPLSLATFGISAFLINVLLLWGISFFVPGFEITSFVTAIIASLLLSLVSLFLHKLAWQ
jgi:putative membrane protein